MTHPLAKGTNRAFSHSIRTSVLPDAVWRLWSNPSTWREWDLGLKDAKLDGAFALGAVGELTPKSGPKTQFRITSLEPGRTYTFATALPLAQLEITRTILSTDPTVFEHQVTFRGPLGGLWAQLFGPGFRRDLPPTMERIAQLAEAGEAT